MGSYKEIDSEHLFSIRNGYNTGLGCIVQEHERKQDEDVVRDRLAADLTTDALPRETVESGVHAVYETLNVLW